MSWLQQRRRSAGMGAARTCGNRRRGRSATPFRDPPAWRDAVTCRVASAGDESRWDAFVASRPDASGYHLWGWRRVFEQGLGHRSHYLVAERGGSFVGVLPLVEVRSRLFGRALSSLPYVNYGGVLAADAAAGTALVARAGAIARDRSLSFVLLRHRDAPVRRLAGAFSQSHDARCRSRQPRGDVGGARSESSQPGAQGREERGRGRVGRRWSYWTTSIACLRATCAIWARRCTVERCLRRFSANFPPRPGCTSVV